MLYFIIFSTLTYGLLYAICPTLFYSLFLTVFVIAYIYTLKFQYKLYNEDLKIYDGINNIHYIIFLLSTSLFYPIVEEIFYRKIVREYLMRDYIIYYISYEYHIWIISLMFSLSHIINMSYINNARFITYQVILTFFLGYYCYIVDNLYIAIMIHMLFNMIQSTVAKIMVNSIDKHQIDILRNSEKFDSYHKPNLYYISASIDSNRFTYAKRNIKIKLSDDIINMSKCILFDMKKRSPSTIFFIN